MRIGPLPLDLMLVTVAWVADRAGPVSDPSGVVGAVLSLVARGRAGRRLLIGSNGAGVVSQRRAQRAEAGGRGGDGQAGGRRRGREGGAGGGGGRAGRPRRGGGQQRDPPAGAAEQAAGGGAAAGCRQHGEPAVRQASDP